jgi:lysophospholipase L1-like esterase
MTDAAAPPLDDAARPLGTALTVLGFLLGAGLLSTLPGVPPALRPLEAETAEARIEVLAGLFTRPRVTLVEHERQLAGDVAAHDDVADVEPEDTVAPDDIDVVDAGPATTIVRPAAVEQAGPLDRSAYVAAAPWPGETAMAALHDRLKMPGAVVDNPCLERIERADGDAAAICGRTALGALFSTFDALARGEKDARAHVIVLGNSLIASDHVVDVVRARLAGLFGDGGRGLLLPERLSKIAGRRVRTGRGSPGWTPRTFALDAAHVPADVQGLTGSLHEATVEGDSTVWEPDGATLGELWWLDPGRGLRVEVDDVEVLRIDPRASGTRPRPRRHAFRIATDAKQIRLVAGRGAQVYGVTLEREAAGVVVDTVGVPAASARGFVDDVDAGTFSEQLAARDPALVVFMLGGNETRSLASGALTERVFADKFTRLIARARDAAPRAGCLVVTPIDAARTTTTSDELITRPELHTVIAAERQIAHESGCAFFDLFAAMGGDGSLGRMRQAQLISDDLVHPRARGGDVLGALFASALVDAWRTTPPSPSPTIARRHPPDPQRPRLVGLSFPEEDRPVAVSDDDIVAPARPRALARFFARLRSLEEGTIDRVAIGQLGASHTAGQMLTDRMRQRLGARFGEVGRGYISAGTASKRLAPSGVFRDVVGSYDVADGREVDSGGAVGMAGTKLRLAPGARFRVGFCTGCPIESSRSSGHLTLAWLHTPDMGSADVLVNGMRVASLLPSVRRRDSDVQHLELPIGAERATLEVIARSMVGADGGPVGPVHLLSVSEEMNRRGIVLDAAGLPGTTGMTAQRWRQDLLAAEIRARDYDLVVTAWGTNEAGIASLTEETYRRHFDATLSTLLAAAPRADCLIIGATDRFDRKGNAMVPAANHELVERVQRSLAAARGCAFFSMRDVMGGPGSMRRWVADGLARQDHVHFTREGYARLADTLVDELLAAYAWSASDPRRSSEPDDAVAGSGEPEPSATSMATTTSSVRASASAVRSASTAEP